MVSNVNFAYLCEDFTGKMLSETNKTADLKWFDLDELPENISSDTGKKSGSDEGAGFYEVKTTEHVKPALKRCIEVLSERSESAK